MNILVVIVLGVLVLCVFDGYRNGFLKTVLSLVSWIIVFVVCSIATPMVSDFFIQNTEIETTIQGVLDAKIDKMISDAMEEAGLSEIQGTLSENMEVLENIEISEELEAALPEELREMLRGTEDKAEVEFIDTADVAEKVVEIISLLIVLAFTRIALGVLNFVLGIASKLPLLGPVDKLLGLICGGVKGLIFAWIILTIVSALALTGVNTEWVGYIAESEILTWLQNNNVILNLVVK